MSIFILALLIVIAITEYYNIKILRVWKTRSYEVMEALLLNIVVLLGLVTYTLLYYDMLVLISTIVQIVIVIILFIDSIRLKL